nr:TCR beta chain [Dicentrarchus labrax]
MILLFICITFNSILVSGSSLSEQVYQTPADMYNTPGGKAEINCSHSIQSYDRILWYKQTERQLQFLGYMLANIRNPENGVNVKMEGSANKGQICTLIIEELQLNSSAVYFCAADRERPYNEPAYFGQGTKLTVLEKDKEITGPSVKVLQPSPKECKNEKDKQRKKTLVCVAKDFYPDHVSVSWEINGQNVTNGVATDEAAQLMPEKKFYQITSRLRVPAKDWENSDNEFKCIVNFFNKTHTVPYTDSIYGEAVTTTNVMTREKYVKITQAAKLTYSVFIAKSCIYGAFVVFLVWKLQGSKGKQNY